MTWLVLSLRRPQHTQDTRADFRVVVWFEGPKQPMVLGRQMRKRMAVCTKNIVIEESLPCPPLGRRPLCNGDHAEEEGGVRSIRAGAECIPPVVDEPVEVSERLNLMPPQLRQVQGVP